MSDNATEQDKKRNAFKGVGVSPGVVIGPAILLTTQDLRVVIRDIRDDEVPREISRLEEALIATRHQIREIQQEVSEAMGPESAGIFDAHLLVVDDRAFVDEVIRGLHTQKKNVDAILEEVTEKYAQALSRIDDDYLRERAADVRDVARRILRNLAGQTPKSLSHLEEPSIIIANDLAPSDTATLDTNKIIGFATDQGSMTSHTAIMARALEIPAIVGLHDVSTRISHGTQVLIDGNKGLLIVNPSNETLEDYGKVQEVRQTIKTELAALKDQPAETKDGYHVHLSANIELPEDVDAVLAYGARGVGLFRTEFIYLSREDLPNEEEQASVYGRVADRIHPDPLIIRTIDLGGDKFTSAVKTSQELNPFMGWRAIRFCLANPEIFKAQLRAILRVSRDRNVQIMYPLVSKVEEILEANVLLEEAKRELDKAGFEYNPDIDVGAMIEVPSAALCANLIAPHVKFFSLGTNDLVQYTLAVDRINERISYLYEPTHPSILKLLKSTIDVGHEYGIWTGICGEMAGNPLMVPLLVGLGADELSVSPASVPMVKDAIRSITFSQAEDLANQAVASESGEEVTELCRKLTSQTAPEILELIG